MYIKGSNGQRLPFEFFEDQPSVRFAAPGKNITENFEKPEGSNKSMLYLALLLGVAVVAGTGYLIWKHQNDKNKKNV